VYKTQRTAVELVAAVWTVVLSVAPEGHVNTRSIVASELIRRTVSSRRLISCCQHARTEQQQRNILTRSEQPRRRTNNYTHGSPSSLSPLLIKFIRHVRQKYKNKQYRIYNMQIKRTRRKK